MYWDQKEKLNYRKDRDDAICFVSGGNDGKSLCVAPHWHDELEITLCGVSGDLSSEGFRISYNKGDVICIHGGAVHSYTSDGEGCYKVILINPRHLYNLGGGVADQITENLFLGKFCHPVRFTENSNEYGEILSCFQQIFACYETKSMLRLRAAILSLLSVLHESSSGERQIDEGYLLVQSAVDFMSSKFSEKITIDQVAKSISVSKFYFIRLFEKYIGMTPVSWLIRLRLEKSLSLLHRGETITNAAFTCGFNNLSYFNRKFKEFYGVTPKAALNSKSAKLKK